MLMRTLLGAAVVFVASLSLAEEQPSPALTDEERSELLTMIQDSQDRVMALISGLSDEQWTFKQNPDRWSVAECTEHIVLSQRALLQAAQAALGAAPDPEWHERTNAKADLLKKLLPNRQPFGQGGASAPQEIRPSGTWDRAQALREFYTVQGEVVATVETLAADAPLKQHTFENPFPIFGWLNAYDWLIYIPLHTERHSRQIEEVQADANYPKN